MKVEVSIGEVMDKMTILAIKKARIKDPVKNANVCKELDILSDATSGLMSDSSHEALQELVWLLHKANETLWEIEDAIRLKESKKEFDQEFIDLARSVYITNDRRFELKRQINTLCGSSLTEEKQHIKY